MSISFVKRLCACALMALALLASQAAGFGQTLYGALTGNITDGSGAAIPNVKLTILNVGTGIEKQALTDERGSFLTSDLQPGTYRVMVAAPSFQKQVLENVSVDLNTVHRLDLQLQLSQLTESVTVNAAAVTLQTDRADINDQIGSIQTTDLPLINSQGRNFQAIYKILPGLRRQQRRTPTQAIPKDQW